MICDYCGSKASSDEAMYCEQCGSELIQTDPSEIFHFIKACPFCPPMKAPKVVLSPRPWRVLVCKDCGNSYRTIELIWIGEKTFSLAEKYIKFLKVWKMSSIHLDTSGMIHDFQCIDSYSFEI
jgi:hypothetical protein